MKLKEYNIPIINSDSKSLCQVLEEIKKEIFSFYKN
jgi:hypothetical protein